MGTIRHGRYILADISSSLYYLNLFHLWQWSFHVPYILLFLILMCLRRNFKRRPTRFQRVLIISCNTYSYAKLSSCIVVFLGHGIVSFVVIVSDILCVHDCFFWFCKCCSKTAVIGIIIYHVSTCMISLLKIGLRFCAFFRAHTCIS